MHINRRQPTEEKKIIPNEKKAEEQLDNVAGGIFIQTGSVTCSRCGKMFPNPAERERHEKNCKG